MCQPTPAHRNHHIVNLVLCERGKWDGEIQVFSERMKMRMVVLNGLIADPFCSLRSDKAFKNVSNTLIARLSESLFSGHQKTDTLPFVKWTKRQDALDFTGYRKIPRKRRVFKELCELSTMDQSEKS